MRSRPPLSASKPVCRPGPGAFRREVREAYLRGGESVLLHAATGAEKTYAVRGGPPCVLWVTPLRALTADTEQALEKTIDELGIPWALERRTSDTSARVWDRRRQRLPSVPVATPESLSLFLRRDDVPRLFAGVRCAIVDEWHELLGTKRGVQTEFGLDRDQSLAPCMRIWRLSATLGNLDQARDVFLGPGAENRLVEGEQVNTISIESIIPTRIERFPWAGHIGTKLLREVVEVI